MTESQQVILQSPPGGKLPTLRPVIDARLRQLCAAWKMTDEVPYGAIQFLTPAIEIEERRLDGAGIMGVAVILKRLWAIFPQPEGDDALEVWTASLAPFPADLIAQGVSHLIATRTWQRDAPVPAMILESIRAEYDARVAYRNRLKAMQLKAKLSPPKPPSKKTDEDRAAMLERIHTLYPEVFVNGQ